MYANTSVQFVNLVKGGYGKTPWPVDPAFRKQISGKSEEQPYDTSKHVKQVNEIQEDLGGRKLAANEKEELLLELFPAVAKPFLRKKREADFRDELKAAQDKIDESNQALLEGLSGDVLS
jgi:pyruvate/oxaloacetate carboxyltransferase